MSRPLLWLFTPREKKRSASARRPGTGAGGRAYLYRCCDAASVTGGEGTSRGSGTSFESTDGPTCDGVAGSWCAAVFTGAVWGEFRSVAEPENQRVGFRRCKKPGRSEES